MEPANVNNRINSSSDESMGRILMELANFLEVDIEPDSYLRQIPTTPLARPIGNLDNRDLGVQQTNMTTQVQIAEQPRAEIDESGASQGVNVAYYGGTAGEMGSFQCSGLSYGIYGQGISQNQLGGYMAVPILPRTGMEDAAVCKRTRRLIKNRESAARSRARKLARTLQLQIELESLQKENQQLNNELKLSMINRNSGSGRKEHGLKRTASASDIDLLTSTDVCMPGPCKFKRDGL